MISDTPLPRTDPTTIPDDDQEKLIRLYERLCPDELVSADDPRRPAIAAEMFDIGLAPSPAAALEVISWWGLPEVWAKEFIRQARRAFPRMKLSRDSKCQ